MSGDDSNDDDKVGYKKPPREHQWKPGQSGNIGGRKRQPTDMEGFTEKHLKKKTRVKVGTRVMLLSNEEVIAMQLVEKAKRGERHATNEISNHSRSRVKPALVVTQQDEAVKQAALRRLAEEDRIQSGWTSKILPPKDEPDERE